MDPSYEDYLADLVDDSEDEDLGPCEVYDPEPREDFGHFGDPSLCGE